MIAGGASDRLVPGMGVRAEFAHAAEDRDAPARAGNRSQRRQRGLHRIGIRIVTVVEKDESGDDLAFEPAGGQRSGLEPGLNFRRCKAKEESDRGGEEGIADHVSPRHGQGDADPLMRRERRMSDEIERGLGHILGADGAARKSRRDDAGPAALRDGGTHVVVGVEDDASAPGERPPQGGPSRARCPHGCRGTRCARCRCW